MRSDLRQKRRAYLKGKRAEWVAALYLTFKGYEILNKTLTFPHFIVENNPLSGPEQPKYKCTFANEPLFS